MKHLTPATIIAAILTLVSCTRSAEAEETHTSENVKKEFTLFANTFMRGKVLSVVEDGDSTAFVYNSNRHVVGFKTYSGDKQVGEC